MKDWWLYALELEGGYFYVGITNKKMTERLRYHIEGKGKGSYWTARYRPLRVIELRRLHDVNRSSVTRDEDLATIKYVRRYGIDRVYGGHMCYQDVAKNARAYKSLVDTYRILGYLPHDALTERQQMQRDEYRLGFKAARAKWQGVGGSSQ